MDSPDKEMAVIVIINCVLSVSSRKLLSRMGSAIDGMCYGSDGLWLGWAMAGMGYGWDRLRLGWAMARMGYGWDGLH